MMLVKKSGYCKQKDSIKGSLRIRW